MTFRISAINYRHKSKDQTQNNSYFKYISLHIQCKYFFIKKISDHFNKLSSKHIYIMNETQSHIKKSRMQPKSFKGGYFWDSKGIRWASAMGVYGHIPSDSCIWQFRVMLQWGEAWNRRPLCGLCTFSRRKLCMSPFLEDRLLRNFVLCGNICGGFFCYRRDDEIIDKNAEKE